MANNKLLLVFIIPLFFSCNNESNIKDVQTKVSEIKVNPKIEGNAYVITHKLKPTETENIVVKFESIDTPSEINYLVTYNPNLHQSSDVLLSNQDLIPLIFTGNSYVFIQHFVKDYKEWEKKFLTFEQIRESYHIRVKCVLTHYNNPKNVLVIAEYKDIQAVNDYGNLITDSKAMENAGVLSRPVIQLMSK